MLENKLLICNPITNEKSLAEANSQGWRAIAIATELIKGHIRIFTLMERDNIGPTT